MRKKKSMRPSTLAVLLAVILLMLVLSHREQNKSYMSSASLCTIAANTCLHR